MKKPIQLTIYSDFDLQTLMESEELIGTLQLEPKELPVNDEQREHRELYRAWKEIKDYVRMETGMNKVAFATWLKPLNITHVDGSNVYVYHPQKNLNEYIETKYFVHLMAATIDILDKAYCFRFDKEDEK